MCCCCCGSKHCICWACLSILLSGITILIVISVETHIGAPIIPTDNWDLTFKLIYAGNAFSICACVVVILILRPCANGIATGTCIGKVVLLIFMDLVLISPLAVSTYFIYILHSPITVEEVSQYTSDYYEANEKPPPVIQFIEELTSNINLPSNIPFGCCGAGSFEDYIINLPQCDEVTPHNYTLQFNGSPTCCFEQHRADPLCASNLQYMDFELKLRYTNYFIDRLKNVSKTSLDDFKSIGIETLELFVREITGWIAKSKGLILDSRFKPFKLKYDCAEPFTNRLLTILPSLNDVVPPDFKMNSANRNSANRNSVFRSSAIQIKKFLKEKNSGIHVIGCAKLVEIALKDRGVIQEELEKRTGVANFSELIDTIRILITTVAVCKNFVYILAILFFNWYFVRLILPGKVENHLVDDPRVERRRNEFWQVSANRIHGKI